MLLQPEPDLQEDTGVRQIHFAVQESRGLAWITDPKDAKPGVKHIFCFETKNILFGDWTHVIYQKLNGDTVCRKIVTTGKTITYLDELPAD